MQNLRVRQSWRLPPKFQRQVWEAKQYVMRLESLQADPDRGMCGAVRMKPGLQWIPCKNRTLAAEKLPKPLEILILPLCPGFWIQRQNSMFALLSYYIALIQSFLAIFLFLLFGMGMLSYA